MKYSTKCNSSRSRLFVSLASLLFTLAAQSAFSTERTSGNITNLPYGGYALTSDSQILALQTHVALMADVLNHYDQNLELVKSVRLEEEASNVVLDTNERFAFISQGPWSGRFYAYPSLNAMPIQLRYLPNQTYVHGEQVGAVEVRLGKTTKTYVKCADEILEVSLAQAQKISTCGYAGGFYQLPLNLTSVNDHTVLMSEASPRAVDTFEIDLETGEIKNFVRSKRDKVFELSGNSDNRKFVAYDSKLNTLIMTETTFSGLQPRVYLVHLNDKTAQLVFASEANQTIGGFKVFLKDEKLSITAFDSLKGTLSNLKVDIRDGNQSSEKRVQLLSGSSLGRSTVQTQLRYLKSDFDSGEFVVAVQDPAYETQNIEPTIATVNFKNSSVDPLWSFGRYTKEGNRTPFWFSQIDSSGQLIGVAPIRNQIFLMNLNSKTYEDTFVLAQHSTNATPDTNPDIVIGENGKRVAFFSSTGTLGTFLEIFDLK